MASLDDGTGELDVKFSEPVQWLSIAPGHFEVIDDDSNTETSLALSAGGPTNLMPIDCTSGNLTNSSGVVNFVNDGGRLVTASTGLPVSNFSNFPCSIAL